MVSPAMGAAMMGTVFLTGELCSTWRKCQWWGYDLRLSTKLQGSTLNARLPTINALNSTRIQTIISHISHARRRRTFTSGAYGTLLR